MLSRIWPLDLPLFCPVLLATIETLTIKMSTLGTSIPFGWFAYGRALMKCYELNWNNQDVKFVLIVLESHKFLRWPI